MPTGLLILDKPAGMTSHDVVNAVRRLAGVRQVGHTGTLDPLATGVLLVLIGPATRLARYLSGVDKTYRAGIRLGVTTTTYDAEGDVVEQRPVSVDQATLEAALAQFRGPLLQVPPMVSALKVGGKKLYELARKGQEVERAPRPVTIHSLTLTAWNPPDVSIEVACSSGTYIRSLAYDLGQILGCGAHLAALQRTVVGAFQLEQAYTLDQLAAPDALAEVVVPPSAILPHIPAVTLSEAQVVAVRYGQTITLDMPPDAAPAQAWDADGNLVAMLIPTEMGGWRPELVLA